MNKVLLISFLLLGVGIHSSTSSPFLNTLQSLATAVRNSGINQAVGVPVVAAAQTVTSNAGALVNTGSLAPASSAQVDSTVDGVTGLPGGVAEVVEDQVKQDQVKAFLDNTEAILQNFNTSNPLKSLFVDYLIGLAFRVRSISLQCRDTGNSTWDSSGCEVDCVQNHGYTGGICNLQYPNVDNLQYSSQQKVLFCTCTDNNGTLSTTGRDSPLPPTTPTPIISPAASSSSSSEEVSSSSSAPASSTDAPTSSTTEY